MTFKLVNIVEIIHVIYFNFISLSYFEIILDLERFNPHRVEIVHHYLSHANLLPHFIHLFEQDHHAVSTCERIQIW